jgi:tetratricopeptide (TPR) repeat protein
VFPHDQVFAEEEAKTYACPFCGAFVAEDDVSCPGCGAEFVPEGEVPEVPRKRRRMKGEYAEEDIEELLKVPGIGRFRAEILCEAGFNSIRKLRAASVKDLARVKLIGPKVAKSMKEALASMEPELPEEEPELPEEVGEMEYECPACGVIVSPYESACFECGTVFEEEPLDAAMKVELEHVGESASSLAFFDMKILEDPTDPELWFSRANLLRQMGKLEEALDSFNKVIELRPEDRRSYIAKADLLTQLDRFQDAAEAYQAVIMLPLPEEPEVVEEAALEALMELEEVVCPTCGETVLRGARLCPTCGAEVRPPEPREVAEEEIPELRALEELERIAGPAPAGFQTVVKLPPGRPVGLINGVSLVNGRGRVNGQIDTKGFINGSGLTEVTLGRRRSLLPRYVALALSLLLLLALTVPLIPPAPPPALAIAVDGDPSDWQGVRGYSGDVTTSNPDIDLASYAVRLDDGYLFFLIQVRGTALGDTGGMDAALIFVDADGNRDTGYALESLGADHLLQVYGGGGEVVSAQLRRYAAAGNLESRTNWTAWENQARLAAAAGNGTLEVRADTYLMDDFDPDAFSAVILLDDQEGLSTRSVKIGKNIGAVSLVQVDPGDTVVARGPGEAITRLEMKASAADVTVRSLALSVNGAPVTTDFDMITVAAGSTAPLQLSVDTSGYAPGERLEVRVASASATGPDGPVPVSIDPSPVVVYVESPPAEKAVDGWFGDWRNDSELNPDTDAGPIHRPGLDLNSFGSNQTGTLGYFYLGFEGPALSGDPAPVFRARPPPSAGGPSQAPTPIVTVRRGAEDSTRIFIDSNSSDSLGILLMMGSQAIRADLLLTIRALHGEVLSADLSRWQGVWQAVPGVAQGAITGAELEASVLLSALGEMNATEYLVVTSDWRGRGDQASGEAPWGTRAGTRAIVTIESTTSSSTSTAYSSQRKLFYDGTNYWAFYYDGTRGQTRYEYSDDGGATWSGAADAFATSSTNLASVWWYSAGNKVYIVGDTNADDVSVIVREGDVNAAAHTITWSSETTVDVSGVSLASKVAYITRDTSGYIWVVSSTQESTGNYNVAAVRSTSTNDITAWGSRTVLRTAGDVNSNNVYPIILPLGSGDVYALWYANGDIQGRGYESGSWLSAEETIATTTQSTDTVGPSVVVDSSNAIHLFYVNSTGNVGYYYNASGTWTPGPTVDTNTGNAYPTVTLLTSNDNLYALYVDSSNQIQCRTKAGGSGGSWSTCPNVSTDVGTKTDLTSIYSAPFVYRISWEWLDNNSPDYDVQFEAIPEFEDILLPLGLAVFIPIIISGRRRHSRQR